MAKASYFPTNYDSGDMSNQENIYTDDATYTTAAVGQFITATRRFYAKEFSIVGNNNGQIPSGATINSVNTYGQGRTTGAGTVGVQPYVDGVLRNAAAQTTSTSVNPVTIFSSGAQIYRNGTTPWTTDDLDNDSFKMDVYYYRSSGWSTYYGFHDYTKVEIDYDAGTTIELGSDANTSGTGSSLTLSVTTSGSNRGLLVAVITNSSSTTFSSVQYNSVNMQQESLEQAQSRTVAWYSLTAPSTGANTLSISFGQSNTYRIFAIPLTGVNQIDMVGMTNTGNGASSACDVATTPSRVNSYLFSAVALTDFYYCTEKSGQGLVSKFDEGSWCTGVSYKITRDLTSTSNGWYFDTAATGVWTSSVVEVRQYVPYSPKVMMVH